MSISIGGLNDLAARYLQISRADAAQVRHCGGPGGPGLVLQFLELHHQRRERLALRAPELGLAGGAGSLMILVVLCVATYDTTKIY